jgi:hypothetical protein
MGGLDAAHLRPIGRSPSHEYELRPIELSGLVWAVPRGT